MSSCPILPQAPQAGEWVVRGSGPGGRGRARGPVARSRSAACRKGGPAGHRRARAGRVRGRRVTGRARRSTGCRPTPVRRGCVGDCGRSAAGGAAEGDAAVGGAEGGAAVGGAEGRKGRRHRGYRAGAGGPAMAEAGSPPRYGAGGCSRRLPQWCGGGAGAFVGPRGARCRPAGALREGAGCGGTRQRGPAGFPVVLVEPATLRSRVPTPVEVAARP
ncbi:protein of unknown function [Streptomyces murinus]